MDRPAGVTAPIPGPKSRTLTKRLQRLESRNVTYVDDTMPIFWESAAGATVLDVDGNAYIDLTAAFGVANAGHGNPAIAAAVAEQVHRLAHAMGDVHPSARKVELLEAMRRIVPAPLSKAFLASTGADAIEAAMKTAMLYTGKPAFAAFTGGYHGLSLGTLQVTAIERFRDPFLRAIPAHTEFLPYPRDGAAEALESIGTRLRARGDLAAVIVEPLQGRGGCIVPRRGFLPGLRELCNELGVLLILDELYTGMGRTGTMFAFEDEQIVPDILCVGKALGNGMPISAAIGTAQVMDAWPPSAGEALHTSTHLGNPVACAAAIATITETQRMELPLRAKRLHGVVASILQPIAARGGAIDVRGRGLMWGIELRDGAHAKQIVRQALREGVLLLQAGDGGNVLSITPPLTIKEDDLIGALHRVAGLL